MKELPGPIDLRLAIYCSDRNIEPRSRLGFGKDGSVWMSSASTALKVFASPWTFTREREVYGRLASQNIRHILEFAVPKLLDADEGIGVIEMSIVQPPFVLDFASATLDAPPDFPEEVLTDWFAEKREQFGDDWPRAAAVIRALERLGIFMLDVHPGNIRAR